MRMALAGVFRGRQLPSLCRLESDQIHARCRAHSRASSNSELEAGPPTKIRRGNPKKENLILDVLDLGFLRDRGGRKRSFAGTLIRRKKGKAR